VPPAPERVFCSHRQSDKPRIKEFAAQLLAAGIDAWVDEWEILPGDDFVSKINDGLARCDAGLIFFSSATKDGKWVGAEISALIVQMIEGGKRVIPVMLDPDVLLPPLLRARCRIGIEQFDQIVDAIRGRTNKPPITPPPALISRRELVLQLRRIDGGTLGITPSLDGQLLTALESKLTSGFFFSYADFINSVSTTARSMDAAAHVGEREKQLARMGEELGQVLLPGELPERIAALLKENCELTVVLETSEHDLLAIPFEAARLPDGRCLVLQPGVSFLRRLKNADASHHTQAGPLRILVAIGAPDENLTRNSVLDPERELGTIMNAIDEARAYGNAYARILSVGHPKEIEKALDQQSYHVLHLSGHGGQGTIELETEDGEPETVTAGQLQAAIRGRVPLVVLASCHSGVGNSETASLAQGLIREGVPMVLAMQASVGDGYATDLAGRFYGYLTGHDAPLVSRALAQARRDLERDRFQRPLEERLPEYATPALFTGAREIALLDRSLLKVAWKEPERAQDAGSVPMLSIGDLVGRRTELRRVYRILADHPSSVKTMGHLHGCQITGMGGVGKSTLAGRLMARLSEEGWLTVSPTDAHWSLAGILETLRSTAPRVPNPELRRALAIDCQDDNQRLTQLKVLLAEHRVLLVLDNFEDNLTLAGDAFRDPLLTQRQVLAVIAAARRGRVLITSRYPVPGTEDLLAREELGALTDAQTRKLLWRHETLRQLSRDDFQLVLRSIGGHPRMIEYLHGLQNRGRARFPNVTTLLRRNAAAAGVKLSGSRTLTEAIEDARRIGTADILLDELLATLDAGDAALLGQVAVFPRAVTPEVIERCLVHPDLDAASGRLAGASLLTRADGRLWVHRWTAEAIAGRDRAAYRECCASAGRALEPSPATPVEDDIDAVRLLLAAGEFDDAARVGQGVMGHLMRTARQSYVAALAGEIALGLERGRHPRALAFRGTEADALLTMGEGEAGLHLSRSVLQGYEQLVRQQPGRADFLRDLSVSYERMGDLMRDLGQGDAARDFFQKDLDLREQLVRQEPGRADFLRDLSVSYSKMGDLMRALGQGDATRDFFQKALDLRQQLVRQEPGRADFQYDLAISYERMGLARESGNGVEAQQHFASALQIRERLVTMEPGRADFETALVVSLFRLGDRFSLTRALDIVRRLESEGRLSVRQAGWRQDLERRLSQ
jgi:tetratricopeptide (TPR) repeat protein